MPLKKNFQVKAGIIGGSFNPLHLGHINSFYTIRETFQLDKIIVVPAFRSPLAGPLTGASPFQRLEMLRQALDAYSFIEVDEQELKRQGTSYSYRTVENLAKRAQFKELFFIMGLDQFSVLDRWKNVHRILKQAHLIVTSRPKFQFPKKPEELPSVIQAVFKSWSAEKIWLKKPFRKVYFFPLKDKDISSSRIKTRLKNRQSIAHLVPPSVDHYIKTHRLYDIHPLSCFPDKKSLVRFCKTELENKQALDVQSFHLTSRNLPFSEGLLASSPNTRHAKALCRHLRKKIQETFNIQPLAQEGEKEGRWIVLDYNELVIHIFYDYVRDFYKLEEIWKGSASK